MTSQFHMIIASRSLRLSKFSVSSLYLAPAFAKIQFEKLSFGIEMPVYWFYDKLLLLHDCMSWWDVPRSVVENSGIFFLHKSKINMHWCQECLDERIWELLIRSTLLVTVTNICNRYYVDSIHPWVNYDLIIMKRMTDYARASIHSRKSMAHCDSFLSFHMYIH